MSTRTGTATREDPLVAGKLYIFSEVDHPSRRLLAKNLSQRGWGFLSSGTGTGQESGSAS